MILLAPRNPDSYEIALRAYEYIDDVESLRSLSRRAAEADLDLSDDLKKTKETLSGERDVRNREGVNAAIKLQESVVARARSLGHRPTLAAALATLATYRIGGLSLGIETDLGRLVALADEAQRASPSVGCRAVLVATLLARAEARLAGAHPAFAERLRRTRRTIGATDRVAALLSIDGPLMKVIADDPDARRAVDLIREGAERRPKEVGPLTWAMLRVIHPEAATRVVRAYSASEADQLSREIRLRIDPYSATRPSSRTGPTRCRVAGRRRTPS